jgi:hypothetical protein
VFVSAIACGLWSAAAMPASAQMVTTGTTAQSNGHRFGEQFSTGWTLRNPHFTAQFGGGGGVPFGGAAGNPGFATGFQAGPFGMTLSAGQSASTFSSSTSAVLTSTNGYPASMFFGSARPFVTGVAPVSSIGGGLGNFGPANTVAGRIARGELHVGRQPPDRPEAIPPAPAPLHQPVRQAAGKSSAATPEVATGELIAKGDSAVADGKPGLARVYYRLAAARTNDLLAQRAAERLRTLDAPATAVQAVR